MDSVLDALGDIYEPVTDFLGFSLDTPKLLYVAKRGLYFVKIFIACYLIWSAVKNIKANQSYIYMVKENGIFKIITNIIKLILAWVILNKLSLKLDNLLLLKKKEKEYQAPDAFSGWCS